MAHPDPPPPVVPLALDGFDFAPHLEQAVLHSFLDSADHDGLKHQLFPAQSHPETAAPNPQPQPAGTTPPTTSRGHRRRAGKRRHNAASEGRKVLPSLAAKHTADTKPIRTTIDAHDFPAAAGAYTAKKGGIETPEKEDLIRTLVDDGFRLVEWDASTSRPIVDKNKRVVAVLVSIPKDRSYSEACDRAYQAMMQEGSSARFSHRDCVHKRGRFPAVNVGITHGQGGDKPVNLLSEHAEALGRLLQNPDMQRVASFADSAFAYWGRGLYHHYHERLVRLWGEQPNLRRNFQRSIFPTAAFNFGPRVRTYLHRDHLNCPYGWCAVQALGKFNPKEGGHLVLWELKLVVEFPPNSLIFLPSAAITHSNLSVKPSETRISFTQYCPGAILRYIDNGMNTDKDLRLKDEGRYAERMAERKTRWLDCIKLLPTLDDLGIKPV